MQAVVHHIRNPLQPQRDCVTWPVKKLISVDEWLLQHELVFSRPTICTVNGVPVLREHWATTYINDQTVVAFITLPQGRGGSNPVRIIMMIVVVIVAAYTGQWYAAANYAGGAAGGAAVGGIVSIVGMTLVNILVPPPALPSTESAQSLASPSPTYNLGAQGNRARLREAIPVAYGRNQMYPDFAAQPYLEYRGNEQYLYELFSLGWGSFDIEETRIEDTSISNFAEVEMQVCGPGETVTLFPTDVTTSVEVSGQTLEQNVEVGPFVINEAGTEINKIGFDVVLPQGLFYAEDDGTFGSRSVAWTMLYRKLDDAGDPIGIWMSEFGYKSMATNTPQRFSYTVAVSAGRYEAKVVRTSAPDGSSRAGDSILWVGLRGYHAGDQQYGQTTVIAVKMRATDNLSAQASRKFNVIATRKLAAWNPSTEWGAETATSSIAWAAADVCRNADYGAGLDDNYINLQQLYDLETTYSTRGDTFNAVFDSQMVLVEALTLICRAGRTIPYSMAGVMYFARDGAQTIPRAVFSARNIVKGSLQIEYSIASEDTADAVTVEYLDDATWAPKQVDCVLDGGTSDTPASVKMFGVTDRDQAWREGRYMAAANRYRRKLISFQTELEGHIPTLGDQIAISHEIPEWGQSGEVTGWDDGGTYPHVTVAVPLEFADGETHYIAYRKDDGTLNGPHEVIAGADEYEVIHIDANPGFIPYLGNDKERTVCLFGTATTMKQDARVLAVVPRNDLIVEIRAVNERPEVHLSDGGSIPAGLAPWNLPATIDVPVINALSAVLTGTADNRQITMSWTAAAGADHYLVDYTIDGVNWTRVVDCISTTFTFPYPQAATSVRVAPVGVTAGAWVTKTIASMTEVQPPDVQGLTLIGDGTGTYWRVEWTAVALATHYNIEVVADSATQRSASTNLLSFEYCAEDALEDGGPWRSVTIRVRAATATQVSETWTEVVCGNPAPAELQNISLHTGYLTAHFTYDKPADRDFAGVRVCMSETEGFTPGDTNVVFEGPDKLITVANLVSGTTYYFRLAAYDTYGTTDITYSTSEYSLTATSTSTSLEILSQLRSSLTDPDMQSIDGDLVINAERFAIRDTSISGDVYPLIVADGYVALSADVIINGTLSVANLDPGELPTDTYIDIGSGTTRIDGDGSITLYDGIPSAPPVEDFAFLYAGDLVFKRYRDSAYHEYKSVKRREYGVADSGDTVTIPGYWFSEPRILPSLSALQAFDASYVLQDQQWEVRADNLREDPAASGIWKFDAVAELTIAGGSGTTALALIDDETTNVWSSDTWEVPSGLTDLTINVSLFSKRGTGNHTYEWYNRQITWTVYGYYSGAWHALATGKTKAIGSQISSSVSDSQNFDPTGLGVTEVYVGYVAADAGGTFSTGSDQYYAETSATRTANQVSVGPYYDWPTWHDVTATTTLAAFDLPGIGRLNRTVYTCNVDGYAFVSTNQVIHLLLDWGIGLEEEYTVPDPFGAVDNYDITASGAKSKTVSGSYDRTAFYAHIKTQGHSSLGTRLYVTSPQAVIYYQLTVLNSTAIVNQSNLVNMVWDATGATTLAAGALSYIAVGD